MEKFCNTYIESTKHYTIWLCETFWIDIYRVSCCLPYTRWLWSLNFGSFKIHILLLHDFLLLVFAIWYFWWHVKTTYVLKVLKVLKTAIPKLLLLAYYIPVLFSPFARWRNSNIFFWFERFFTDGHKIFFEKKYPKNSALSNLKKTFQFVPYFKFQLFFFK